MRTSPFPPDPSAEFDPTGEDPDRSDLSDFGDPDDPGDLSVPNQNRRAPPPAANPLSPRRRGAPLGNKNALKHGYYTARFRRSDLKSYEASDFTGLSEEITLLRLYIRRVVDLGVTVDQLPQSIDLLRVLSLAVTSLNRLVKTHALLATGEDELSIAIREVYEELTGDILPPTHSSKRP